MKIGRRASEKEISFTESIFIARNICCACVNGINGMYGKSRQIVFNSRGNFPDGGDLSVCFWDVSARNYIYLTHFKKSSWVVFN